MRYTGESCPICGIAFSEDDDVVVCPECGTPHHRKCYLQNNACANAQQHTESFAWSPSENAVVTADTDTVPSDAATVAKAQPIIVPPTANPASSAQHDGHRIVFCPQCGSQNASEEPVCTECGARLYNTQNQPFSPPIQLPDMTARPYYSRGAIISPTETLDGNTVGDTAEYVRIGTERYIPKFYGLEKTGKKLSWNWAAFIFSPCWFFYRKLYAVGGILLTLMLVLTGATMTPRYLQAFSAYADVVLQSTESEMTYAEVLEAAMPAYQTLQRLPETQIQYYGTILLHLFSALSANYFYKKKVGKDISTLRAQHSKPEEYRFFLFRRGGVSMPMALASCMILFFGRQILLNILSALLL